MKINMLVVICLMVVLSSCANSNFMYEYTQWDADWQNRDKHQCTTFEGEEGFYWIDGMHVECVKKEVDSDGNPTTLAQAERMGITNWSSN